MDAKGQQPAALLVERLTKVYVDGTRALDALQLRIPAGAFFGLLGPNGAGKTTLIGSVAGLVRAPAVRIFVFGHDAVTDRRARLLLGLAPQEVHLDGSASTCRSRETARASRALRLDAPERLRPGRAELVLARAAGDAEDLVPSTGGTGP